LLGDAGGREIRETEEGLGIWEIGLLRSTHKNKSSVADPAETGKHPGQDLIAAFVFRRGGRIDGWA
jgi:hypothetical protein